ncbi:SDR family NAD(P)-dependent oxidoreductase [Streptantibioticus rubrisoli]|uniref:SDR family oxidoreductase n=1 Tax=Streptantibioticus rubrisoli TaxID=1387313 RepID=A0ABT1PMH3_9ACTN|nr:SDR family oxidoreductase [Streptantibioticus rubrisoli]MCQ4046552.1 SDR family oxidoreductase [Streptantibioticus rubrisoli]
MTTTMITGATSGIGAAFARRFAAMQHDLILVARDQGRLERTAADLRDRFHIAVDTIQADLSVPADCRRVEERLALDDSPVDILVNNAGFGLAKPFPHSPVDDEERMLDVLVRVPLRLTHAAVHGMLPRRRGSVLNVASVAGLLPTGTYGAAKAWLIAFSESLRVDLAPHNIQVLALCPGFTRTEFQQRAGMDVSALPERAWLDAEAVVDQALRDLRRHRPVSITGLQYKAYAFTVRHVPRVLAARLARPRNV